MPVPMVEWPVDWVAGRVLDNINTIAWEAEPDLLAWKDIARVERFSALFAAAEHDPRPEIASLLRRYEAARGPGMERLTALWEAARLG